MDEYDHNHHSLTVVFPNHQSIPVKCDYETTIKELKEAIRNRYEAADMPLPIDKQILYTFPAHSNKPLLQTMYADNVTVGTLMLMYNTDRFKLAIQPAYSENVGLIPHEQCSFLRFIRNLIYW